MTPGQTAFLHSFQPKYGPYQLIKVGHRNPPTPGGRQPAQSLVATCHEGLRFSTKAATPSLPSSPCKQRLKFSAA